MWMRSLNGESDGKGKMKEKLRLAVFGHKRWSREGGVEIVVKELCTRMAQQGCQVTCYNRSGHHVSGAEYDDAGKTEYEGIRQKSVPTIERREARDIIRGCHNRDKGTAENEGLRNPKFIFAEKSRSHPPIPWSFFYRGGKTPWHDPPESYRNL